MKSRSQRMGALVQSSVYRQLAASEEPAALRPEEVLVADARGGLTPVQMVEQKVRALLGSNYPGLFSLGGGRRGNIRRIPGT